MADRPLSIPELVAASRAAQGLPPKVEDLATLARIAAILRPPRRAGSAALADGPGAPYRQ